MLFKDALADAVLDLNYGSLYHIEALSAVYLAAASRGIALDTLSVEQVDFHLSFEGAAVRKLIQHVCDNVPSRRRRWIVLGG